MAPATDFASVTALRTVRALAANGSARTLREAARLTCAEMAAAVGVSESAISRWERGERRPHGDAALRYAELLLDLMGPP